MLLGFQSSVSASLTCKLRWCFEAIDIVHYVYLIRYLHNVYFYINAAMNFLIFWVWSPFPRSSNLVLVHVLVLITSNICKNNDLSLRKTFWRKSTTSTRRFPCGWLTTKTWPTTSCWRPLEIPTVAFTRTGLPTSTPTTSTWLTFAKKSWTSTNSTTRQTLWLWLSSQTRTSTKWGEWLSHLFPR